MRSSLFFLTVLVVYAVQCAQSVSNDHSQCQSHGHLGACNVGKLTEVWRNRCMHLSCATKTKIGNVHVAASIGKAAVGTICGISQACNARHQCVFVRNLPRQDGPTGYYPCQLKQ